MRLSLSFAAACLVTLALFLLMLNLIAPPTSKVPEDPLAVGHFVRMGTAEQSAGSASRQPAPDMPQPRTPPQAPTPVTPTTAAATPRLPTLNLEMPTLSSEISIASAPTPTLEGLAAAPAAPSAPGSAPAAAASGAPAGAGGSTSGAEAGAASAGPVGGTESDVMPLNDVRPRYPREALRRGIEGHVKLAFTINRAGAVENIRVLEASPRNVFEREARSAAARWRFAPRIENGLAVDREAVKTLHFKIRKGD